MERVSLRQQAKECFLYVFCGVILAYVVIAYPLLVLGVMHRVVVLASYYSGVLLMSFVCFWAYFGVPRLIIRRCGNCGSKNMLYSLSKKFFCGDCGYSFKFDLERNAKLAVLAMSIPASLLGVFILFGITLAGETINYSWVFFGVLLSVWFPTVLALLAGLYKLFFYKVAYFHEHKELASTLFFITLIALMFFTLISFGILLKFIFTGSI